MAISPSNSAPKNVGIVTALADRAFARFRYSSALSLRPIMLAYCPHRTDYTTPYYHGLKSTNDGFALPRLGKWQHGNHGTFHEGKLIMRSDMVDNFFVHYVSQRTAQRIVPAGNNGESQEQQEARKKRAIAEEEKEMLYLFPKRAVLYHFKQEDPFFMNTLIPGMAWNDTEKQLLQNMTCSFKQPLLFVRNATQSNGGSARTREERGDIAQHGLTLTQIGELFRRYNNRLQKK